MKDSEEIEARIDALYESIGEDLAALSSAPPEQYRELRTRLRRDMAEWRGLCDCLFGR